MEKLDFVEMMKQQLNTELCTDKKTQIDYLTENVKAYNSTVGDLPDYNCPKCKNKGHSMYIDDDKYQRCRPCECMRIRKYITELKKSGLDGITSLTFEKYTAPNKWQAELKKSAIDYAKNPQGWFFIGGQPGSGKTHLCTAIMTELIKKGYTAKYAMWQTVVQELNAIANDIGYQMALKKYIDVKALYIDDFLKSADITAPNKGEKNRAFDIINLRYVKNDAITIISSEKTIDDILKYDNATGSRIYEKSKNNCIVNLGADKNYRLK